MKVFLGFLAAFLGYLAGAIIADALIFHDGDIGFATMRKAAIFGLAWGGSGVLSESPQE